MQVFSPIQKKLLLILPLILLIGILFIATYNFLHLRSLWLDEAMLALNISEKSVLELLQPLDLNQVAPIGFLLLEKLTSSLLGNNDWTLRLIPFLAYLGVIYYYYRWYLVETEDKLQASVSTLFVAATPIIIFYSSEVKQYETDVLCMVLLYFSSFKLSQEVKLNKSYIIISSAAVWFSNIAIIPLTTIAVAYGINQLKKGNINFKMLSLNIAPAFVSFAVYYLLFIHGHPSKETMLTYWSNENAFLTGNLFSSEFWQGVTSKFNELAQVFPSYSIWFVKGFVSVGLLTMVYKKKWTLLILIVSPILLHLGLSYFKLYPFSKRLIIYLIPLVIFTFTYGVFAVLSLINVNKWNVVYLCPIVLLYFPLQELRNKLPFEKEEIKPCLELLNKKSIDDDQVYVYYGAQPAFSFYSSVQPMLGTKKLKITAGSENRLERSKYQGDFDNSNYNWLVFSHAYWKEIDGMNEEEYIIQLAKENGYAIIDEFHQKGASLYQVEKH